VAADMIDPEDEFSTAVCSITRERIDWLRDAGIPDAVIFAEPLMVGVSAIEPYRGGLFEPRDHGAPAVLVPVGWPDYGGWELDDIVAFYLDRPGRWWRRSGSAQLLGGFNISEGCLRPLQIHSTPLHWLIGGADGLVVIDWSLDPVAVLSGAGRLNANSPKILRKLRRRSHQCAAERLERMFHAA
jgi:hypothetical protein